MNAQELRIGNLVKSILPLGGSLAEKCRFDGDIFQVNKDFIFHDLHEKCTGIPFTKEWALKFGFGKDGEAPNRIVIESELGKVMVYTDGSIPVHRFQNIYFDLTNSELTIKETVQK